MCILEDSAQALDTIVECPRVLMAIKLIRDVAVARCPDPEQTLGHRQEDPSRALVGQYAALFAVRLEVCGVIDGVEDEDGLERLHREEGGDDGWGWHCGEVGELL